MNVLIENGKIICKRKIFSKEIFPTELEKIIVTNSGTVLQFKNHSKPIAAKNKLNPLLDDLSCLIKNQISYEDTTQETCGYPENQISELLHRTKSHTETIANKILANYLGKEYAVHIEIVGEPLYSMLVFRLKKEEQVLYQHPSYEKIEKLGVDTALDAMDLTFLIKWDASWQARLVWHYARSRKSKRIRSLHCFSHRGQICIGKRLHLLPKRI